ncbi:hypothetical protein C7999DRAFT_34213 [Corynascus novoguineensis]|uniref:Putative gamma-glutamylcyclotransferase n=1 Tax=Corynascus novoguineensis TaxID=1126955 RepID=A0AAN7CNM2_9PEZI|nr:hypothetical protein C7999DRAFT_34213 [Corynascus novoguineensis]
MSKSSQTQTPSRSVSDAESSTDVAKGPLPPPPPPPPPLPPRLIGVQAPQPVVPQRSDHLDKLASMPEDYLLQKPPSPPYVHKPIHYFFYGTLMNPAILQGVLGFESQPDLRSAKVYGYELTNWAQYKTLIDSNPGTVVTGRAYMAQSAEEEYKLAYYETNAYSVAPWAIYFTDDPDGKEDANPTIGKTFRYAGDAQALKQGRFDWVLWETQMGRRLPPQWRRGEQAAEKWHEAEQAVEDKDGGGENEPGIRKKNINKALSPR